MQLAPTLSLAAHSSLWFDIRALIFAGRLSSVGEGRLLPLIFCSELKASIDGRLIHDQQA